jgi:hypothetical protein
VTRADASGARADTTAFDHRRESAVEIRGPELPLTPGTPLERADEGADGANFSVIPRERLFPNAISGFSDWAARVPANPQNTGGR